MNHATLRVFKNATGAPATVPDAVTKALSTLNSEVGAFRTSMEASVAKSLETQRALEQRLDQIEARGNRQGEGAVNPAVTLMKSITDSAGFTALKNGATSSGRIALPGSITTLRKTLTSNLMGGSPNVGYDVQPQRSDRIGEDPRRSLALLDALPHLPVNSNTFEFQSLLGYVSGAAVQAVEGTAKAETDVPLTLQQSKIVTVAHFVKASKQVLDDAPSLQKYLGDLMTYGVLAKFEALAVNGTVSGDGFDGLLAASTVYVGTATAGADRISEAAAALEGAGWHAGLVVVNPLDWHRLRISRASGSQEYLAGSWAQPASPNVWGLPLVTSASVPAGTALVLDPQAVAVLDREQATVMIGYDADDFTKNKVTLLAELRGSLAVFSNGAVLSVLLGL